MSDLINKSELIDWLRGKKYIMVDETSDIMSEDFENKHKWELSRNCFINDAVRYIQEQPAVKAVPVTAEWIKLDEIERDPIIEHGRVYRNYSATFRCSKCYTTFAGSNLYFNYCPYCGKKMKGVKNNG